MADLAWNGVGLSVPDTWEPAGLERDGLLLEHDGRPACELKWSTVQGVFSFDRHLKRLARLHKGVELLSVDLADTPPAWAGAVAELERAGLRLKSFLWRADEHRGLGASLHHPATGLAALVQFFVRDHRDEDTAASVLATLRDHTGGRTVPWTLFGLTARVPAEYRLETFSFRPGRYTVRYWRPRSPRRQGRMPAGKGPGARLVFERFVPADVLLRHADLAAWTRATLDPGLDPGPDPGGSARAVAWAGVARTSPLRRLLRRERHARGRVWTTPENAILAVTVDGTDAMEATVFATVAGSYGLV
ncbi:MAG: hypothetical protein V3571_04835 [Pseudodesulfovibrio sp.]